MDHAALDRYLTQSDEDAYPDEFEDAPEPEAPVDREALLAFIQEGIGKAEYYQQKAYTRKNNVASNFQRGRIDAFYSIAKKLGYSVMDIRPHTPRIGPEDS